MEPYAVWTGSYNFTKNAEFSLENAVYIKNSKLACQYFSQWGQIASLSEPLDWRNEGIVPDAIFE